MSELVYFDVFVAVVRDVLEQFAFMFTEQVEAEDVIAKDNEIFSFAKITYEGPEAGCIRIVAPQSFNQELAANVLGSEMDEVLPKVADDALKELANIMCGELLHRIYGDMNLYKLSIPVVSRIDGKKWNKLLKRNDVAGLSVDGYKVLVNIETRPHAAGG